MKLNAKVMSVSNQIKLYLFLKCVVNVAVFLNVCDELSFAGCWTDGTSRYVTQSKWQVWGQHSVHQKFPSAC